MNIFALSADPKKAAEAHGDKHVVKMILETCQMLYSAHWTGTYPELLKERSSIKISKLAKTLQTPKHMKSAPLRKSGHIGFTPVHLHHPCTIWVRELHGNYMWAADLALWLATEYEFRWPGRQHSCKAHAIWLKTICLLILTMVIARVLRSPWILSIEWRIPFSPTSISTRVLRKTAI